MDESGRPPAEKPRAAGLGRLIAELRRRRVGRAAVTYAAVAWLIIEIVGTLFPMIGLPDWAGRVVVALLALGFPIALVLAWALEIGPDGIERTGARGPAQWVPARASRGWALIAAGAAVGACLMWATPRVARIARAEAPLSADVMAVLPFGIRGSPDLAYLGEGIVDLLSAKLNGAGAITTVDPRLVIAAVGAGNGSASDPARTRAIAREVGAGRYVTGDLVQAGGRIRVSAHLHATDASDDPAQQADVEGTADEIFDLLDRLVAELVASSLTGPGDRVEALATLTTPSLEAAKAYLEGERLLRSGLYREAAVLYDEAVELDSAFALAHYRKSIAADWIDAYTARTDADRAYRFRDRLPPRDRALVTALQHRRHGRITESEQALRALLHQYPHDVEALVQIGELYFHDNPRRGRPMSESIEPFRRALELEPANPIAQVHIGRMYALEGSIEGLRESAGLLMQFAPESDRALEVTAMLAYMTADTSVQSEVKRQFAVRPWYYTFHVVHGVERFARDPHGAAELLEARPSDDPLLLMLVPQLSVIRGQYEAARAFLDRRSAERNATWDIYKAFLLTSGAMPLDRDRMTSLLPALARITPADVRRSAWLEPYEDLTDRFFDFQRDYYRALILIQLGRAEEAAPLVDALEAHDAFTGLGTVKADAVLGLRAETLLQAGDRGRALELLQSMQFEIPHAASYQPMPDQSRARFLRSELEFELGDPASARAFLVGLDEPWSVWDTYHRPLLYQRLAEDAEARGRTAEAIAYYTRLVRIWQDCDPELVPRRDEIARRLATLRSRS